MGTIPRSLPALLGSNLGTRLCFCYNTLLSFLDGHGHPRPLACHSSAHQKPVTCLEFLDNRCAIARFVIPLSDYCYGFIQSDPANSFR